MIKMMKIGGIAGCALGFACGYLYGVGGFVFDIFHTGINRGSWLALNALLGMPLLFTGIGSALGLFVGLLLYLSKKLSTAKR